MGEVNLLRGLPERNRNIKARESAKTNDHVRISSQFDKIYFDGPREFGYGGYKYDGRWKPVAYDIVNHFDLKPGDKVLDVGCAKGFLVKDLLSLGIDAFGIDISRYAVLNCEPEVVGRLQIGSAEKLPFPDHSFNAVLSINTLHNLPRDLCLMALSEIERLSPSNSFVQVDSFKTKKQKEVFEAWVLTALTYGYPEEWLDIFDKAGYSGDYFWNIMYENL
jgi:ubiquinone/menaquinone biosynthesis C-methylase UbiE